MARDRFKAIERFKEKKVREKALVSYYIRIRREEKRRITKLEKNKYNINKKYRIRLINNRKESDREDSDYL